MKLATIAEYIGATLHGNPDCEILSIGSLKNAQADQISFLTNSKLQGLLSTTKAAAVIISNLHAASCPIPSLVVDNPHLAYAQVSGLFATVNNNSCSIDSSAYIDSSAHIEGDVTIGKNAVIHARALIGKGSVIGDNCVVGANTVIEKNCFIYPNVSIYHDVLIGNNVIIHAGSVIGADGLGFALDANKKWHKIHHLGSVSIGDDVEIGAGATIDRASLDATIIGEGVKLDSQVHVGHNVVLGKHTIVAANTAIGGSSNIGNNCIIGGSCNIVDNIVVTDDVMISGATDVLASVNRSGRYSSANWLEKHSAWLRSKAVLKKIIEKSLIKK
ncbi:UDP-3-O-(3-hydroxymyristoyl)glucosamine N-acyltransferase [Gammaproteobacteria bacterium]|nr:UDP-3-O-(3-hydroxymyristoyl)glucosamine N-acyltransferase [Gammaproteobacteria bacterium]